MRKNDSIIAQLAKLAAYLAENGPALKARGRIEGIRASLALVNMRLGPAAARGPTDQLRDRRIEEFDHAMILLTRAKWFVSKAMSSGAKGDWKEADRAFKACSTFVAALEGAVASGRAEPLDFVAPTLENRGTELLWANGVPLIPEIQPIVMLVGSDEEMGRQYALQLGEIFGTWILERKAGKGFSAEDLACQARWEEMLSLQAPEFIPFSRGFAAGARALGVAMSYEEALDIWTGHRPPVSSIMGLAEGLPRSGEPLCSGLAAWGSATKDGLLAAAASGDHDPGYTVTIIAYPETGNAFIYTPFGATGDVGKLGPMFMTGHPGMNSAGLAYVEHGGEPRYIEPRETWGYGIRKGPAVMHVLRYASSARDARDMELAMPIGDVGTNFGSCGGFWADSSYGCVLESRADPIIVREAGDLGERDFLYANNSACHPLVAQAEWMRKDEGNWVHEAPGGWRPRRFTMVKKLGGTDEIVRSVMRTGYDNSFQRNLFAAKVLREAHGSIDAEYLEDLYRRSGTIPSGSWKKASRDYMKKGLWGRVTIGHASNALVTIMLPRGDGSGTYRICVGPLTRGLAPMGPTFTTPIRAETNVACEITLAPKPVGAVRAARSRAASRIFDADLRLSALPQESAAAARARSLRDLAARHGSAGDEFLSEAISGGAGQTVPLLAKALREYASAQVRARQAVILSQ